MLTACVGAGKEIGVLLQHGGDHGSQAIESLTHVNGTAAQIDLRTGRDVQDHETLFNAISTGRSTRSLMKASVRTRAPFGRSISMTPVRSSSLARSAAGGRRLDDRSAQGCLTCVFVVADHADRDGLHGGGFVGLFRLRH
jgi:hypothetical protein